MMQQIAPGGGGYNYSAWPSLPEILEIFLFLKLYSYDFLVDSTHALNLIWYLFRWEKGR